MELFGIVLSIPAAVVISAYLIFAGIGIELLLLITLGAFRSRDLIGPVFYRVHLLFFFCGAPAVANIFVLRSREHSRTYFPGAALRTSP